MKAFADAPEEGDSVAFGQYAVLCLGLAVPMALPSWLDLSLPE